MGLKQRLKTIENKVGLRAEPLVVFILRRGATRNHKGGHKKAVIIGGSADKCVDAFMHDGESGEAFETRVMEMSHERN